MGFYCENRLFTWYIHPILWARVFKKKSPHLYIWLNDFCLRECSRRDKIVGIIKWNKKKSCHPHRHTHMHTQANKKKNLRSNNINRQTIVATNDSMLYKQENKLFHRISCDNECEYLTIDSRAWRSIAKLQKWIDFFVGGMAIKWARVPRPSIFRNIWSGRAAYYLINEIWVNLLSSDFRLKKILIII